MMAEGFGFGQSGDNNNNNNNNPQKKEEKKKPEETKPEKKEEQQKPKQSPPITETSTSTPVSTSNTNISVNKDEDKDYKTLYNHLKHQYDENKAETDELINEYESTIQMLNESVDQLTKEKNEFEKRVNDLMNEQKKIQKDYDNVKNKNTDKIKDIEILTNKNDKLIDEINKLKEEKNLFDSKIVGLENDNEHYLNKLRENEALIDDLNMKLESALEENISIQTDYESYKVEMEAQLIRNEEEIKELKNEIVNNEKIIKTHRESISIGNITNNYLAANLVKKKSVISLSKTNSTGNLNNKIVTPAPNINEKQLPEKFLNIYRKSISINPADAAKLINVPVPVIEEKEKNKESSSGEDSQSSSESPSEEQDVMDNSTDSLFLNELKPKKFEKLDIMTTTKLNIMSSINTILNEKAIAASLQKMLISIQQRKKALNMHKKDLNEKMVKLGIQF
jgi:hypothetical protein